MPAGTAKTWQTPEIEVAVLLPCLCSVIVSIIAHMYRRPFISQSASQSVGPASTEAGNQIAPTAHTNCHRHDIKLCMSPAA